MTWDADPARAIARMFSKLDDADKETFNQLVRLTAMAPADAALPATPYGPQPDGGCLDPRCHCHERITVALEARRLRIVELEAERDHWRVCYERLYEAVAKEPL